MSDQQKWNKKEIVLWGLGMCGGVKGFVDTETVGVYLFESLPGLFGLKKHPQYPDIDVARVQLADAKKEKGEADPARVIQDTDERKARSRETGHDRRILSRDPMWKLNEEGVRWFNQQRAQIQEYVDSSRRIGERRGPGSIQIKADKISHAILDRIRRRTSFASFSSDPGRARSEKDLGVLDFFAVFNVDAHTPQIGYEKARTQTLAALGDGSQEAAYAQTLSKLYGTRYRTYYDEMLAQEDTTT
jgi:hypothetical protein